MKNVFRFMRRGGQATTEGSALATSSGPRWRQRLAWPVLIVLLLLSVARPVLDLRPLITPVKHDHRFFDLRVMLENLGDYEQTGVLYDTRDFRAFDPMTTTMFKYPPPHAVVLRLLVPSSDKSNAGPTRIRFYQSVRPLILTSLLAFAGTLLLASIVMKPTRTRAVLMAIALLNWRPHMETLGGPQLEALLLLLLGLSLVSLSSRRPWLGGVWLGVAGAIKIYPWILGLFYALRRRFDVVAGLAGGALVTFLLCGFLVPLRFTWEYLTKILPRLGGISTSVENAGVLAHLTRLAHALTGTPLGETIRLNPRELLADPGRSVAVMTTLALFAVLVLVVALVTTRAWRRARAAAWPVNEGRVQGIFICLMLFWMPSSWMNYQSLLILPLFVAIAGAPPVRGDPAAWALILFAAVVGGWPGDGYSMLLSVLRSLMPLALWGALLRQMTGHHGSRNTLSGDPSTMCPAAS